MGGYTIEEDALECRAEDERDLAATWDDLDSHLIGEDLPDRLEDHDTAERMLRSVARRKRELARSEELARIQHERIDEWLAAERSRLATDYFEACLTDYHAALLDQDPKAKTIHLPSGDLTSRAGQPRWEIDDEPFLAWAEVYGPSLVRVKKEPDVPQIKAALQADPGRGVAVDQAGEIVPGVRVLAAETSFKVKVGEQ